MGLGPCYSLQCLTTLFLRLLICTWEGPWAFLAVFLGGMDFQVDSLALQAFWALVALSQLWMVEEGFLLGSVEDSGHSGQGQDAGVSERSWLLVAGLLSLIHCHPVLSCCLKCVWRTELTNAHASLKHPEIQSCLTILECSQKPGPPLPKPGVIHLHDLCALFSIYFFLQGSHGGMQAISQDALRYCLSMVMKAVMKTWLFQRHSCFTWVFLLGLRQFSGCRAYVHDKRKETASKIS